MSTWGCGDPNCPDQTNTPSLAKRETSRLDTSSAIAILHAEANSTDYNFDMIDSCHDVHLHERHLSLALLDEQGKVMQCTYRTKLFACNELKAVHDTSAATE